jgi:PAS domain S-box-containing protein
MTTDRSARDLRDYVKRLPGQACLLVGVPSGRIESANPAVWPMLGVDPEVVTGRRITGVTRALWRSEPMRLLLAGAQTGFAGPTTVRLPDGRLQACVVSALALEARSGRRWVLAVFDFEGDRPGGSILRHTGDVDIVVGLGDGNGNIGQVSRNIVDLLGYEPDEFVGLAVAGLVHVDDFPHFMTATSAVVTTGRPGSFYARLRHADGHWVPVRLLLTSLHDHPDRALAFVAVPDGAAAHPADGRTAADKLGEVEHRLRRIALEIAALGIVEGLAPAMPPEVAVALSGLSAKRQEIVSRLQAGNRVPTIAQAMFLSQSTIRNHLSAVFRELGVSSQEELLLLLRSDS